MARPDGLDTQGCLSPQSRSPERSRPESVEDVEEEEEKPTAYEQLLSTMSRTANEHSEDEESEDEDEDVEDVLADADEG